MALTISNGYVVYQRGAWSKSPYWRKVHRQAVADASTLSTDLPIYYQVTELGAVGNNLIALGQSEKEKERQIIFQCLGIQYSKDSFQFVKELNKILTQKEQLSSILVKLKDYSTKNIKNISSNKQFSSWFVNHLGKTLSNNLNVFLQQIQQKISEVPFTQIETDLENIIFQSFDQALDLAIQQGISLNPENDFYLQLNLHLEYHTLILKIQKIF